MNLNNGIHHDFGASASAAVAAGVTAAATATQAGLFNRAAKKSHRRNVKFWKKQAAYNHPAQQMQRLKEAGLNPSLIYGAKGGNTGNVGSLPPAPVAKVPDIAAPVTNALSAYQGIKESQARIDIAKQTEQGIILDNMRKDMENILLDSTLSDKQRYEQWKTDSQYWDAKLKNTEYELWNNKNGFDIKMHKLMLERDLVQANLTGKHLENALKAIDLKFALLLKGLQIGGQAAGIGMQAIGIGRVAQRMYNLRNFAR